jgi:transposase
VSSGMLIPPGPVRVLVATKPVDFRKGMNGLAAVVQEQLKADPFSGTIYCFRSKRADRVKLVFWDGTAPATRRLSSAQMSSHRFKGEEAPLTIKQASRPDCHLGKPSSSRLGTPRYDARCPSGGYGDNGPTSLRAGLRRCCDARAAASEIVK